MSLPDQHGYFGEFGGRFVSELLMPALIELDEAYDKLKKDTKFKSDLKNLLADFAGRPTRLTFARNLSKKWGAKVYLKREDMLQTGAHKINNTLGQGLIAKHMKKSRVIAETGAGQHGVATATAAALLKFECQVYMGTEDLRRQELNAFRMKLLGAKVTGVGGEKGTLRDAVNEALRDWSRTVGDTHYILGSVVGPHPFPKIVGDLQSVIGKEARSQISKAEGRLPDAIIACVGGGSNAIGFFRGFLKDSEVQIFGVEAGGSGGGKGQHSATLGKGTPGVLHGARSFVLQDERGLISDVHSVSAGLDYPGVGPEHSYLKSIGRVSYVSANDEEALAAFQELTQEEGIIPALESSHAIAAAKRLVAQKKIRLMIINVSGRGDKDVAEVLRLIQDQKADRQ